MIKKYFQNVLKNIKNPDKPDSSYDDQDDSLTLAVFVVVIGVILVMVFFEQNLTTQLTSLLAKSKSSGFVGKLVASCSKNNTYDKCVQSQKEGSGCVWYGACNSCGESGLDEKVYCQKPNSSQGQNKAKDKTESKLDFTDKQNINCTQMDGNYEACAASQVSGSGCVWQAGCNKCAPKILTEKEVCQK